MYPTYRRKNRTLDILETAIHAFVLFNREPSSLNDSFESLRKKSITGMECPRLCYSSVFNAELLPIKDLWKKPLPGRDSVILSTPTPSPVGTAVTFRQGLPSGHSFLCESHSSSFQLCLKVITDESS